MLYVKTHSKSVFCSQRQTPNTHLVGDIIVEGLICRIVPPGLAKRRKLRSVLVPKAPATLECNVSKWEENRSAELTLSSAITTFVLKTSPGQAWTKLSDMLEI
jgi:hypothetical protein